MPDSRKTFLQEGRKSSPFEALNEPRAESSRYADGFDSRHGSRQRGVPFHVATGVPFVLAISNSYYSALSLQRLRLKQNQQVPEWSGTPYL